MASIRERTGKRGTSFIVLYREDGKQTSSTFDDRKTAEAFRVLAEGIGPAKARQTMLAEQNGDTLTVAALAEKWLTWKEHSGITPRTMTDYRHDVTDYILPRFGDRLASTIDERDVQEWVDAMSRRIGAKSVADRHMLLVACRR